MESKSFWKTGHLPTLVSSFLYFDVSFMIWVLLGALGPYVAQDMGLSATQKGLLTAIPVLGGALFRIPMGFLADRIGTKRAGLIGMIITFVPLCWGWLLAGNVSEMYALGFMLGIAGASFAVALPMASRWYPQQYQGVVMGIVGAGNSGTVLATLFAPRLAESLGWNVVFGTALLPLAVVMSVFLLFAKDSPNHAKPRSLRAYREVLRRRDALLLSLFYGVTFGGFVGMISYLSIFFNDQYGIGKVEAANLTTLCVIVGSLFRPVGGHLSDRFGGMKVLRWLFAMVCLLMFGVSRLPEWSIVLALLFAGMLCLGMGNGAVFQLVPVRFRDEVGVMTGIVGAAGGLGGFFLPTLLGTLKDASGSYGMGFLLFSLVALCALLLLFADNAKRFGTADEEKRVKTIT